MSSGNNSDDNKVIIFLLSGILAVLLLGRDAVLGSIGNLFWIGIGLLVLWIVWLFIKGFFGVIAEVTQEIRQDKAAGKPWVPSVLLFTGLSIGAVWLIGLLSDRYLGTEFGPYTNPAWVVCGVLFLLALIVRFWQDMYATHGTLPKFLRAFVRKLGYVAFMPVLAPIDRARELRSGASKPIIENRFFAGVDVVLTAFGALAGWMFFVGAPLLFLVVWLADL